MREVRLALRSLLSTPTVTFTAVFVLAIGIGATTAIFNVANRVLFRPLPFAAPDRLVQLGTMAVLEFQAAREQARSFESLVSYSAVNKNIGGVAEPERIAAVAAERGLFSLLGVKPLAGRTFDRSDATNVAVVSEGLWRRRFGSRASLDDWKILLDGQPFTVIGIMPQSFQFPYRATATDVWIPMELPRTDNASRRIDEAVGRLASRATIEVARAELDMIAGTLRASLRSNPGPAVVIVPLTEAVVGRSRTAVLTLTGAVVMVLLIACATVASLQLARAEARKREVAVRIALGAGRSRLLRQFLTESILLALAASLAATLVAIVSTRALVAFARTQIPRAFEIGVDWTAFLFLLMVGVGTGVALGLVPALYAARTNVGDVLNAIGGRTSTGRRATALNKALVVVEIALAFILVTGAGLLLRAFLHLEQTPTGIAAERVLTLRVETRGLVPTQATPAGAEDSASSAHGRYFRAIEERVTEIPGVVAAGFVTRLHVQTVGNAGQFTIVGQASPSNSDGGAVRLREASAGYFRALGIPLRAGRWFADGDNGVIVNATLARQYFPGEDPIGRVLDRGTIVGVVGDVRQSLRLPAEPEIYRPLAGTGYSAATLVVKAETSPESLIRSIRAAIREFSPNQPVFDVRTMEDVITSSYADVDLSLWLIGLFAGVALTLAMAGVYGMLSYAVAMREKELGIRLALGADPGRLLRQILGQGGLLIVAGVAIGVAGAFGLTRFLRALLYEVGPTDPVTFVVATLFLAGAATVACLNPARRAMKVDPMAALRHE